MSHTPEPWIAKKATGLVDQQDGEEYWTVESSGGSDIFSNKPIWDWGTDDEVYDSGEVCAKKADALLTSAAPELLQLARGYYRYLQENVSGDIMESVLCDEIQSVIAKAEGKA